MTISQQIDLLREGVLDGELTALYGAAEEARERYIAVLEEYERSFGPGKVSLVSAPGRTELAGNHTDHQNGIVLCAAVTMDTLAAASPSEDGTVRLFSRGFGEITVSLEDTEPHPAEQGTTAAIVRGVAAAFRQRGLRIGGFRAAAASQVPVGGGLSSSAAFENLVGALFSLFYNGGDVAPMTLAQAGQAAETAYFGKPSGLMDQAASACGGITMIDFYDPASPRVDRIDFDFRRRGYVLCAVDTRTSHADLTADYAAIPAEMTAAANALGAEKLRYVNHFDLDDPAVRDRLAPLGNSALGRAEHFFAENARVPRLAEALRRGDMEAYIREMNASGVSSREKLGNVIPSRHPERTEMAEALDRAESLLRGKGAWRIHGGGFAGCIQCLVPEEEYPAFAEAMDRFYGEGACFELRIRPCGVHVLGRPEGRDHA